MADKHVVRFEPVGIEIEVAEDQTILRAAAEQGIMLMHGCKEGQCASCKSFVLDGDDIELDRYSTFALPDYELDEGYTLVDEIYLGLSFDDRYGHSALAHDKSSAGNDVISINSFWTSPCPAPTPPGRSR